MILRLDVDFASVFYGGSGKQITGLRVGADVLESVPEEPEFGVRASYADDGSVLMGQDVGRRDGGGGPKQGAGNPTADSGRGRGEVEPGGSGGDGVEPLSNLVDENERVCELRSETDSGR